VRLLVLLYETFVNVPTLMTALRLMLFRASVYVYGYGYCSSNGEHLMALCGQNGQKSLHPVS
jgi:hypothetical protein